MLIGKVITLRPVRAADLDKLYDFHVDISNRGEFFPRNIVSQPAFAKNFSDSGFWGKDEGMLLIVDGDDRIIGHIEFFKTVNYLSEYELSYILYSKDDRGRGATTEALNLMLQYLFATKPINRIRLVIHPENLSSRRMAEKCGFTHEGTARGAWYNNGRYHDVEIYSILHDEAVGG